MEKETSTTPSSNVPTAQSNSLSLASSGVEKNPSVYVTSNEITDLEKRLQKNIEASSRRGGNALLWLVVLIALGAGGFSGYTAFQNQQKLNSLESNYQNAQNKIDVATVKIEEKAAQLESTYAQNAQLMQQFDSLKSVDQNYANTLNQLSNNQNIIIQEQENLKQAIANYSERNPDDWKLAESYFLVNNANQKAVYEKDIKSALWLLTNADEIISTIKAQDESIVAIREAISKDRATLKNISEVDFRGLGLDLDRAYDNVDQLVLKEYTDPSMRSALEKEENANSQEEATGEISNWRANLLKSANDFASRFVEIRRRDPKASDEFLTPAQDVYLRENIKTRILLAKANLAHGEKDNMQSNLNEAIKLITTYYEEKSQVTTSTIELLNNLAQSQITIATPKVLQSAPLFNQFMHDHLLGR